MEKNKDNRLVIIGTTPNTYYNLEGMDKNNAIDVIE